MEKVEHHFKWL